jgi:hypothetical protein
MLVRTRESSREPIFGVRRPRGYRGSYTIINDIAEISRRRLAWNLPPARRQKQGLSKRDSLLEFVRQMKDTSCLLYQRYRTENYLADLRSAAELLGYAWRVVRDGKGDVALRWAFCAYSQRRISQIGSEEISTRVFRAD